MWILFLELEQIWDLLHWSATVNSYELNFSSLYLLWQKKIVLNTSMWCVICFCCKQLSSSFFFFKLSAILYFIVPYLHFLNLFQAFEFVFLYCLSAGFLSWWGRCAFEQHKKPVGVQIVLCFPYQFGILIELWKLSILCPFENKESLNLKINF